jgi:hypothetical protein
MNKNLKIGLVLLILASVCFLCSTIAFFILKESELEKRLYLEDELKDIVRSKDALARELSDIKQSNRELESKLTSVKEQARNISDEILKEKEARRLISDQLENEKKKGERLMSDVMEEKEERLKIVHQLSKAEDSYHLLKEQYDLMVKAKETLEAKLKEMMAGRGVELERIEVTSDYREEYEYDYDDTPGFSYQEQEYAYTPPEPAAPQSLTASVMVVNRKYNFIVVNMGKADGVAVGSRLDVYRNEKLIAKTKVEKLYDKMSASALLPEWKGANIREGDTVQFIR